MKRLSILLLVIITMTACSSFFNSKANSNQKLSTSPQYSVDKNRFVNDRPTREAGANNFFAAAKEYYFNKHPESEPTTAIPLAPLAASDFLTNRSQIVQFTRLGHSSLLIQLQGKNWLLDPVFSQRVSPVQWAGPKRFHEPPLSLDELPDIEGIVISHNHYDHLDHSSIKKLKHKVNHFLVPLGIGGTLIGWGVESKKITELDWWESKKIDDIEFTATPSQHFSGRGLLDTDKTLWSSWVLKTSQTSIFFSGDSGYFDGFKLIGEKLGPFDYAFMECGAYNKLWADVHMMPEETIQAFKDVNGKTLIPIHNGTFDLSTHAWFEPLERVYTLAKQDGLHILTPKIGAIISADDTTSSSTWWQPLIPAQANQQP